MIFGIYRVSKFQTKGHNMNKPAAFLFLVWFLVFSSSAFAGGVCPQERKTKPAPADIAKLNETAGANLEHGKALYEKDAKPMACKNCHGEAGDGAGKLGMALKPPPLNFTCAETMKAVSAGQMFYTIKNGSTGTGMAQFGATMSDKDIWDTVKYIQSTFMK